MRDPTPAGAHRPFYNGLVYVRKHSASREAAGVLELPPFPDDLPGLCEACGQVGDKAGRKHSVIFQQWGRTGDEHPA
jgi:hypothetical protein